PSSATHGASLMMAMLLGGTVIYALVTTTFGDGLSESWRHMLPGTLAMYASLAAFTVGVPFWMKLLAEAPRANGLRIVAVLGSLVIVVGAWLAVVAWAGRQPLALGTLDAPSGRTVPAAGFRILGWG